MLLEKIRAVEVDQVVAQDHGLRPRLVGKELNDEEVKVVKVVKGNKDEVKVKPGKGKVKVVKEAVDSKSSVVSESSESTYAAVLLSTKTIRLCEVFHIINLVSLLLIYVLIRVYV